MNKKLTKIEIYVYLVLVIHFLIIIKKIKTKLFLSKTPKTECA
jgi:hypothetical protein